MPEALQQSYDVVVIGAGPAGVTAALLLHDRGHRVCVLERSKFPRFVIGESLLPKCRDLVSQIGALEAVEKQGYYKKVGASFWRDGKRSEFPFADQFGDGSSSAWHVVGLILIES